MVDINEKTGESVQFMIDEIKTKLRMASADAIKPHHFSLDHYDDIRDIYELVMSKSRFSISEMEAIVSELGRLRKKES